MNPYATHTAITVFALGAGSVRAVELIVNGGFEAAPPAPGGTITYSGASGPPFRDAGHRLCRGFDRLPGPWRQCLHGLDRPGNSGPTAGLTRTVATVAGQLYHPSFWLGNAQSSATAFYNLPSALTAFGKSAV